LRYVVKPEDRNELEDIGVAGRKNVNWILWKLGGDWTHLAHVRDKFSVLVNTIMNVLVPEKAIILPEYLICYQLLEKMNPIMMCGVCNLYLKLSVCVARHGMTAPERKQQK
jgi:hypothetical protein